MASFIVLFSEALEEKNHKFIRIRTGLALAALPVVFEQATSCSAHWTCSMETTMVAPLDAFCGGGMRHCITMMNKYHP
jgi:hypothetical protein